MEKKAKSIEESYLRRDLYEVKVSKHTFYRLTKEQVEFLNLIEKDGDEIIAIELDRKEDGSIGFNIGFVLYNKSEDDE